MSILENHESITAQGGGGYPPGGYGPPGGGGGGYPPGGGQPPGGWGPPGGGPPGGGYPPGGGPPGAGYPPGGGQPPGGYGPPGGGPPGGGGYGPPGGAPPGGGGYGPPPGGGYGAPGGYGGAPPPYGGGGFQPPPYQPGAPPPGGAGPGFEATDALGFGWNAVTKNFGGVAVPLAVATLVWWLPYIILSAVRGGLIGAMSASSSVDQTALLAVSAGIAVVAAIVLVLSQAYMMGGMTQFALRVARGERPEFGVVFSGGRTFVPMLGATFLAGIGLNIGFALCIVPGLFLMGSWIAYTAFIVDKGMGPVAALSASWQATAPYRVNALVYAILAVLASFAGTLACCVGALLISSPMVMIGNAYIYLKLNGEQPRLAS